MNLRLAPACVALLALVASCKFDSSDRWVIDPVAQQPLCTAGNIRCAPALERCDEGGSSWSVIDDCAARGLVCAGTLGRCAPCVPGASRCNDETVTTCSADGETETPGMVCDTSRGIGCREGACRALCDYARQVKSNVGCEYWAADLDNAMVDESRNAAAQQFAIVVSNPQPDIVAEVTIEQDDSLPGETAARSHGRQRQDPSAEPRDLQARPARGRRKPRRASSTPGPEPR